MRLICPNCDAEYEVDASLIPEGGRDVQCSACGHSWFQEPPEAIAAAEDEAALYDQAVEADLSAVAAPAPGAVPADTGAALAPEAAAIRSAVTTAATAAPAAAPATGRSLDESLMAVLREEAEREASARRAEAAALETQTEMPLTGNAASAASAVARAEETAAQAASSALKKIASLRGEAAAPAAGRADPGQRRELLPEIDEINSTLRAASERRGIDQGAVAETMEDEVERSGGFWWGFATMVLLVLLGWAVYGLAPAIALQVPTLTGALESYVGLVNGLLDGLDSLARALTVKLTGLTGG